MMLMFLLFSTAFAIRESLIQKILIYLFTFFSMHIFSYTILYATKNMVQMGREENSYAHFKMNENLFPRCLCCFILTLSHNPNSVFGFVFWLFSPTVSHEWHRRVVLCRVWTNIWGEIKFFLCLSNEIYSTIKICKAIHTLFVTR